MTRSRLSRAVLALPAALSLALGGALLAAAPASAAPGDPVLITSPQDATTDVERVLTVTGTGSDGATVILTDAADAPLGQPVVVAQGGAWSAPVTFAPDAPANQSITATQFEDPLTTDAFTEDSVTFTLADAVPVDPEELVVTSPADGDAVDSRRVEFVGTATPGAAVSASVDGLALGQATADENGDYVFEAVFPIGLVPENEVTVNVTAVNPDGTSATPVDIQLVLPAPIAAPVITEPAAGSTVAGGGAVTFRGTGVAGETLAIISVPDQATATANPDIDPLSLIVSTVVAEDGSFAVSTTLPLGTYTAVAVHTETPFDPVESLALSLPSNEVTFTLVAAAAPAGAELANTGPTSVGLVGPAAALLLGGLLLTMAARRRGARLVTA